MQPLISKSAFIGMAYMFGVLVGSVINGILSDRIGRKKTLLIAILVRSESVNDVTFLSPKTLNAC